MKNWYQSHSPREQMMLCGAAAAVVVGLLFFSLLKPLYESLGDRRERVSGNVNALSWMQKAAGEAQGLQGSGGTVDTSQAPLSAVARIFAEAGLKTPDRVDPVGNKGARITLPEIAFDQLIPVLDSLDRQAGLKVKSLNVNAQRPGIVSARITLER